jgi:soluble lytic murein transglycosylase-like protein
MIRIFHNIGRRMAHKRLLSLAMGVALACVPSMAGENAVLATGFRIHADRHEVAGDSVKLFSGSGFTELPASQVISFEQDEYVPPAPAAPAPAPPPAVSAAPVTLAPAVVPPVDQPLDPKRLAAEAAKRNNLPEALIRSIMHAESGFRADALSPKGAIGLMQLMPGTAEQLHADPRDPRQNVEAGTAYLLSLVLKYENYEDGVARAVAAYNAGPGAVDRYNGVPPYPETRDYVIRVLTEYQKSITPSASR